LGWLKCDGRALNVNDFYFLYRVIGTSFGGSNFTFNLPNPAGRVPGVIGTAEVLKARHLGDLSGEETHTLTISEMPSHDHTGHTDMSGTGINLVDPGHTHVHYTVNDDFNGTGGSNYPTDPTDSNFGKGSYGKYDSAGSKSWIRANGNSYTSMSVSDPHHNHTFTTALTGGDQPHNNIQPTIFMGNMFIFSGKLSYGNYPYTGNGNIY